MTWTYHGIGCWAANSSRLLCPGLSRDLFWRFQVEVNPDGWFLATADRELAMEPRLFRTFCAARSYCEQHEARIREGAKA